MKKLSIWILTAYSRINYTLSIDKKSREAQMQKGENKMLAYYRIERDKEKRYIVSLYYKNFLGALKEMHRSTCRTPKDVNEVIVYYRQRGYRVQSVMTA